MNVVYLHSHDTGRYIQPYGYSVRTPNLQRLAEEGVLFRDVHCVGPTCSPSRAGLLTGECAHSSGMVALAHRGGALTHPERHLAGTLSRNGYLTALAGVEHVGSVAACGYQLTPRDGGPWGADFAVEFLRGKPKQPFFLDAGFFETHRVRSGFSRPEHSPTDGDADDRYVRPPAVLPDTPQTRRDWADWCVSAERLDAQYGRIPDALAEAGLAENTLVIVTTDHGVAFPDMKCSLTNHGTGVPLIVRGPTGSALSGGAVCDALVSHLDVYPTVCDLLGLERPAWLQGASLLPLVRGEVDAVNEAVFSEVTFHAAFEPKRSVRTKRWNYVRNFLKAPLLVLPNCDAGISKSVWLEHGWADRPVPREALYDLVFDPQERCNVAADPAHAGGLAELRGRLRDWMERTQDPLLSDDPSVLPPDLVVNAWTETDPDQTAAAKWDSAEWALVERKAAP